MPIIQKYPFYNFDKVNFSKFDLSKNYLEGFILKIKLNKLPTQHGRTLVFSCSLFSVYSVMLNKDIDADNLAGTEGNDKIFNFADSLGNVKMLEIESDFLSKYDNCVKKMVLDLQLNLMDNQNKDVYFYFDNNLYSFIVDGEIINQNNVFGKIKCDFTKNYFCDSDYLDIEFSCDVSKVDLVYKTEVIDKSINFYSPRGYNAWAGDVVNFYHNGVYHLLYLYDRHHHGSRWGSGAHTMHHFTTKDFITWEEQVPLVSLDKQWKTLGTGTMFYYGGKYYFSHGWHTSRNVPKELLGSTHLKEYYDKNGVFNAVSYEELDNLGFLPNGATYTVSDDGINFYPSNVQIHIAENPSIFVNGDKLNLVAGYGCNGIWESKSLNGPWKKISDKVAEKSLMLPTDECPSMFTLNGYKYLIMGGTGYWKSEKDSDLLIDNAFLGYDVYDGLVYPMVTLADNRLIMGGWLNGYGWGSVIVHRELFQTEDGVLCMKWIDELSPNKNNLTKLPVSNCLSKIEERKSYYVEFNVNSSNESQVFVRLKGKTDAVLYINSLDKTVQISNIEKDKKIPNKIKPVYVTANERKGEDWRGEKDTPKNSVDFSIANVDFLDKSYKVKLQIYFEPKFLSVIIDAEIGGRRTIVSNRIGQVFTEIKVDCDKAKITDFELYEL